jgi:hypothetical protein
MSQQDEPVSLAPLTPEQALRALLAVRPDDDPVDSDDDQGGDPDEAEAPIE